jgi:hypothetical protein
LSHDVLSRPMLAAVDLAALRISVL